MTRDEFAMAVEKYGDMVFRVAYSALKRREDAEDVMQETLLKLYRNKSPLRARTTAGFGWCG